MRILTVMFLLIAAAMSLDANAQRQPVPIVDHENVAAVTASGKGASADQVKAAFRAAGAKLQWEMSDAGNDKLRGTLIVRNKHTIIIEVSYGDNKYSVKYLNSVNMKYGIGPEGEPVIHPFYNRWVDQLLGGVRSELART